MKEYLEKMDKKKIILLVVGIIIVIVIFFLLNLLGDSLFSKKSYSDVEDIMKSAAVKYYNDNMAKLPNEIGSTVNVNSSDLVSGKYMKNISSYTKNKSESCDGKVNVTNVNGDYRYVSILDCGESYKTNTLTDYIKENVSITESGNGLYSIDNKLVYRGDVDNNYVKIGNNTYRIVKIVDDKVVLIYNGKLTNMKWDDRYNIDKKSNIGINDYNVSRVKEDLEEVYDDNTLFSDDEKLLLSNYNLSIGKRKESDTDKTGSVEASSVVENQYIGLLTVSDFLMASLDGNCSSSTSVSCTNYNYLVDTDYTYWTITADSETSYKVYKIDGMSGITLSNASSTATIKPVIYLVKDAVYVSGDGTSTNPYVVK
jgi:ribosomal protein L14E/L6E/L27E